ncbi:acyltransferase family protein [Paenibacillus sp. XY044]|uniref:acyltransferase family protein n=1 Tax=Paenibacillus sp. XY044 TaxID=2026089 RepID=UPI00279579F2|nr:acyltransferase family protein [Paenibacillus sp. XY044]
MNDNIRLRRNRYSRSTADEMPEAGKRYMPGLDGLRAFSVMAVIAYHLNAKWAQGGLIGVGIFFVISGYLITDQIIQEWKREGRLNLFRFWMRRARRLLPAMLAMLALVALWLSLIDPGRLQDLRGAFLSSLFYVNNWWLIYHKVSYFESFGAPSPIGHLWSLSIEEQFYLIWPLLLVLGLKIFHRRGKLALVIFGLAAISALGMAAIYVPGTDPSRVYYGTDTRAFALLVGAVLAVVWPSRKLKGKLSTRSRGMLDTIGVAGLTVLLVLICRTNEYDAFLYRGGFWIISLLSAAVIAVLAHPASRAGKVMGSKVLRWIGVRSYSLYIWHYPVIILTNPGVQTEGSSPLRILLQLSASFLLAACSYQYIEEPLRRGGFSLKKNRLFFAGRGTLRPIVLSTVIPVILVTAACGYYVLNKAAPAAQVVEAGGTEVQPVQHTYESAEKKTDETAKEKTEIAPIAPNNPAEKPIQATEEKEQNGRPAAAATKAADPLPPSGKGVTAIGDSVMLDAAPFLEKMLPGIVVDGKVGRQMRQAGDAVDRLKGQGRLGDRVIIELGTNGPFNKKQLRSLLQSLGEDKRVLLVNTRVPRQWQDTVNRDIAEVANEFGNAAVVDWYSASEGKDGFFYRDGVHLNRSGAEFYASLLVKTLTAFNE